MDFIDNFILIKILNYELILKRFYKVKFSHSLMFNHDANFSSSK